MVFIDRYESLGVLGNGSIGRVYLARPIADPASTVVVKVLRRDLADPGRARQFFEREITYTARLNHPYIVRVLDSGLDPEAGPCLVMEFVPGTTLSAILKKEKSIDLGRALFLTGCLCNALESAHTGGVIHRDLKPSNLMLVNVNTDQEFLKVMDFGLSQLTTKPHLNKDRLSGSANIVTQGTPAYISPEQLRGDDIDGRADQYSVGIILYEALTGCHPFFGSSSDGLIEAHLKTPPRTFAEVGCRKFAPALEAIVQRCLSKYAVDRFSCPHDLADALGAVFGVDLWTETAPAGWADGPPNVPIAESVAEEIPHDPNSVVGKTDAWMPDSIAIIKLGGFLAGVRAVVVNSEPGVLHARIPPLGQKAPPKGLFGKFLAPKSASQNDLGDGIDLEISLVKPNPKEGRLVVTAVFRVPGGRPPKEPQNWTDYCNVLFEEMKKYLM